MITTTKEQGEKLVELGYEKKRASFAWKIRRFNTNKLISSSFIIFWVRSIPAYTVEDMINMLPEDVNLEYETKNKKLILHTKDIDMSFIKDDLVDSLYDALVWLKR